jgi:uncharacterized protein (DUF4415 family)
VPEERHSSICPNPPVLPPCRQAISLRVDADVVARFGGLTEAIRKRYQTRANRILRERMLAELRQGGG